MTENNPDKLFIDFEMLFDDLNQINKYRMGGTDDGEDGR